MIERTLETLHIKAAEEKEYQEKRHEKEVAEKQAQLNQYIRQYAELQVRQEEEKRKTDANRQFYAVVMHMNYALNGLPRWQVSVMSPPPEKQLNETAYVARIQQLKNRELLHTITTTERPKPVIDPETAAPNLRQSVLEAKEILRRAGLQPDDDKPAVHLTQKITLTTPPPKASKRLRRLRRGHFETGIFFACDTGKSLVRLGGDFQRLAVPVDGLIFGHVLLSFLGYTGFA